MTEKITRRVEVYTPEGIWVDKEFMDIEELEIVRMFEPDGDLVVMKINENTGEKYYEGFVTKAAYHNEDGILTFEYVEITK